MKATRLFILLAVLAGWLAVPRACAQRLTFNFNPDWKFIKADPPGAAQPDFNDSSWDTVSTPHTYNDVDTFDDFSPGAMLGETNQWSGRTWYRKTFALPESARGKKIFVEFDAVRQVAEVSLNGHPLGDCKNGFVPFGFDLTPYTRFGAPNVLAVSCDNRFMISTGESPGSTLADYEKHVNASLPDDVKAVQASQIPWNNAQWHPPMGGIYRDVWLYATDPLHITLPLYDFLQTAGPYVHASEISAKSARIGLEVPVQNDRASSQSIEVGAQIIDQDGRVVLTLKESGFVAGGARSVFEFDGQIANPRLWEPDYPHLYKVVCAVSVGGRIVDTAEIPLGIHAVHWDANNGFWINGHHLKLRGWGQRPTDEWPGLGDAQPDWLHFYTLQLMKDAGANFVRWGHCAGGAEMIRAGDRLGLIADQPGVDGESDTVAAPWQIRADAFRDAVIYFRNNPSILIWEGGNQKVTSEHAAQLRHIVDEYDPAGGRAYAHRRADETTGRFMDIAIGTEGGHEVPRLPVVEGEYDREESPRRVWDDQSPPKFGYPEARGQTYDLTSEQFAVNEISQFQRKIGAPSHCGGANWLFSDGTSGGRVTAEVCRTSGEVDGVRLPKEAYYVCQVLFRDDPRVHIIGHWTYPTGTKKTIYVASNCKGVELFLNGKSLGAGKKEGRYLTVFADVAFAPGELKALAGDGTKALATDVRRTAGPPVALRLTPITAPGGLRADGSDVALINVEAVDAQGARCSTFQQRVNFTCEGPAIWRGGYNSGKEHSVNNKYLDLEDGINRVAVRSTLAPGDIKINATSAGVDSASIVIPSREFAVENGCSTAAPVLPATALAGTPPDWSRLSAPTASMTVTQMAETAGNAGRFLKTFNYSGPTDKVHVESNAADGRKVYCDRSILFGNLPLELAGADWIQAAESDRQYVAVDLMQLGMAGAGGTVYVAHDSCLPNPEWLQRQFRPTPISFNVDGHLMKVYSHRVRAGKSLTLASNAAGPDQAPGNMYIVFVKNDQPSEVADKPRQGLP